jgi:hypothetical protein
MTAADFCQHELSHLARPAFRASPTHGYAGSCSPDKERELSLHKLVIYPGVCWETVSLSTGNSPQDLSGPL